MKQSIAKQIDELERLVKTNIRTDAMQVPRAEGEILAAMAIAHKAKIVVEVGTSYGFSGLWWAAALSITDGHLNTIDILEKKYNASREAFTAAEVADRITNYLGDARDILPKMPDQIDIAFIDADKPNSQHYLEVLWPKLRVGGAILTDNVLSHQAELGDYVRSLQNRPDAISVTIPVGNGLEWTQKLS